MREEGQEIAFHLLGSMNFGMAEKTSDIDVVLYFRDKGLFVRDNEACPILAGLKDKIKRLNEKNINLSVCDCLNIIQIEDAIREENLGNLHLQRFIFYHSTCRSINSRFFESIENLLEEKEDFRLQVEAELE